MKAINPGTYEGTIGSVGVRPKLLRELRPRLDLDDWEERDFVAIADRSGSRGVLWIELEGRAYVLVYSLTRGIIDKASGRARPVICDLCCTQQPGTMAARIGLSVPAAPESVRSLLCCADLACSAHVRGKTMASVRSKAQLRESLSVVGRTVRLQTRLREMVEAMAAPSWPMADEQ